MIVLRSPGFELFYPLTLRYSLSYCDSSLITTLDYTFFFLFSGSYYRDMTCMMSTSSLDFLHLRIVIPYTVP